MKAEMESAAAQAEKQTPRTDGRNRPLRMEIPTSDSSYRLYNVDPHIAVHVLDAHIAAQEKELAVASTAARMELGAVPVPAKLDIQGETMRFLNLVLRMREEMAGWIPEDISEKMSLRITKLIDELECDIPF